MSDLDAKADLPRMLKEVAAGEVYVITVEVTPGARVLPVHTSAVSGSDAAVEALHRFRREAKLSLGELSIRELIEDGRRF